MTSMLAVSLFILIPCLTANTITDEATCSTSDNDTSIGQRSLLAKHVSRNELDVVQPLNPSTLQQFGWQPSYPNGNRWSFYCSQCPAYNYKADHANGCTRACEWEGVPDGVQFVYKYQWPKQEWTGNYVSDRKYPDGFPMDFTGSYRMGCGVQGRLYSAPKFDDISPGCTVLCECKSIPPTTTTSTTTTTITTTTTTTTTSTTEIDPALHFDSIGMGSCRLDDSTSYESLGWSPCTCDGLPCPGGNCPSRDDCAADCWSKEDCAAFGWYDKHCWMFGGRATGLKYTKTANEFTWYECFARK